ncbi:hypothetical protein [uncultured Winogradskyella sp.]|uniref:hypothetical protein n=1 Tax=uncultured Winogradskyella sp. TaxID=395353 RepID=UPI002633AB1E|nr:hypothetical protein [uncultured Winogradskyella sp.]
MKHWKTILALIFMALAIYFDWQWFWAIFILLGLLNMLKSKNIHFVEEVSRGDSPKLYWFMIVIWSLLALYSILSYLKILT